MIKASEIYKLLKDYASLKEQVFCNLHKCMSPTVCNNGPQHHAMLNFDAVKDIYCKKKEISPYKSADGLSYNNNEILFIIEIKGWELYEKYGNPKTEQEVKDKVGNYKLSTKLSDTLMICKNILSETETEATLPVVYLVVSDVKVKKDAIEEFGNVLLMLSETSSDFSLIYGKEITSQLSGITDIDYEFVEDCRQIDCAIESWKKARKVKLL